VTLGLHRRRVLLSGTDAQPIDLDSPAALSAAVERVAPDLIVHTAGLTSVEACEEDPTEAYRVNVQLAANVAEVCADAGVPLVHISTDHLFAGVDILVDEDVPPDPVNVYGRTKAEAEARVLAAWPEALVVRTNIFGWGPPHRPSFSDTIIQALRGGRQITLFEDVHYTPILIEVLVAAVHDLVAEGARGIYHVAGDERVSKLEFGRCISRHFGLDPRWIRPGRLAENTKLVQRPREMSLSNRRATDLLGRALGGMEDQVLRLWEQEREGFNLDLML
jgi:dTDP-4-dehydrorhamnose reductase